MTTAEEAYAANAALERELTGLTLRKDFEGPWVRDRRRQQAREVIDEMVASQKDRKWIVRTLLDELFGEQESHDQVARELMETYGRSDFGANQRSVIIMLRQLVHYREEGLL